MMMAIEASPAPITPVTKPKGKPPASPYAFREEAHYQGSRATPCCITADRIPAQAVFPLSWVLTIAATVPLTINPVTPGLRAANNVMVILCAIWE